SSFGSSASRRALRNKLNIDMRCPDLERFEGKVQPPFIVPQRLRIISKTLRLIGTSLRPSGVLLSGTKITRLSQSRFSMRIRNSSRSFRHPGIAHQDDNVTKEVSGSRSPVAASTCHHQSLLRVIVES